MAFFDKIGDVLSNTGKDIATSAKNVTETTSMNAQIRNQQALIQKTCEDIGRSYYEAHKAESDCEFADKIAIINNANQMIATLHENIDRIKGMQNVPNGVNAANSAPVSGGFCPNCGSPLDPGSTFCTNCGAKIV